MAVKSRSKRAPRIKSVGPKARRVGREELTEALGAEHGGGAVRHGSPAATFALYQELVHRLRSTGGRRRIAGTTRRQKIPIGEADWTVLKYLATRCRSEEQRPTPGQVASVLLRRAITEVDQLRWLAEQLEARLREPSAILWLFAQAVRRDKHFKDDTDARERLLSDARRQQRAGAITPELLCLLEDGAELLPRAYRCAMEAALMPLESALHR